MAKIQEYPFSIVYHQYLNESSCLSDDAPLWAKEFEPIHGIYKAMLFARHFDEKAIRLQRTGLLRTFPPGIGQEAVGVGIAKAMQTHDIFCGYYRDQSTQLERGILPEEIFRYWGGYEDGNAYKNPDRKNDLPVCVPIGTQSLHAVGVAFAQHYKKTNAVTVTTIGDGGTSQGDFYEALNAAGHFKLPLVFIINNNQWAISIPRSAQTASETLAQKAIAAGIEGIMVDGNDPIAMQEITHRALEKARAGFGPTLIEAQTYRLCDHTTADDATRYAPSDERKMAEKKEPIARFKKYLVNQFDWNEEKDAALQQEITQSIQSAADRYLAMPKEYVGATWDHLYEILPVQYYDQKNDWIARENKKIRENTHER